MQRHTFEQFCRLLNDSSYRDEKKEIIMSRVLSIIDSDNEFDYLELLEIEKDLILNQLDPIVYDFRYNQGDIIRHLKKLR